ncbi:MAG: RNA polymerase sigma factor [Sandaracinaceae bacterium]
MSSPSFEAVFAAECGYVVHSLRRLGVRERDLEDIAQDVFIGVHRAFGAYDPARPIRPWLFAFAFRAASNYRRSARVRRESVFESGQPDTAVEATQEERLALEERRRALHDALDTLDLKHRAALILVDLDGVSPKDAAASLEIPLDTVYSRVRNARLKLKEALAAARERNGARHA